MGHEDKVAGNLRRRHTDDRCQHWSPTTGCVCLSEVDTQYRQLLDGKHLEVDVSMTALWGLLWGPWIAIGIFQQQLGSAEGHAQANDGSEVKRTIALHINCAEVAWGARGRQFKSARPDH